MNHCSFFLYMYIYIYGCFEYHVLHMLGLMPIELCKATCVMQQLVIFQPLHFVVSSKELIAANGATSKSTPWIDKASTVFNAP